MLRGVRGAITVEKNDSHEIRKAVAELLVVVVDTNGINIEDIAAIIFSSTPDLDAAFPALGARDLGWEFVPLFGTLEILKPEAVEMCIRVLILWNTDKVQKDIKHIYLREAMVLRPDLVEK